MFSNFSRNASWTCPDVFKGWKLIFMMFREFSILEQINCTGILPCDLITLSKLKYYDNGRAFYNCRSRPICIGSSFLEGPVIASNDIRVPDLMPGFQKRKNIFLKRIWWINISLSCKWYSIEFSKFISYIKGTLLLKKKYYLTCFTVIWRLYKITIVQIFTTLIYATLFCITVTHRYNIIIFYFSDIAFWLLWADYL